MTKKIFAGFWTRDDKFHEIHFNCLKEAIAWFDEAERVFASRRIKNYNTIIMIGRYVVRKNF